MGNVEESDGDELCETSATDRNTEIVGDTAVDLERGPRTEIGSAADVTLHDVRRESVHASDLHQRVHYSATLRHPPHVREYIPVSCLSAKAH